jgi:membrane protease YdiL (CAAX protease family)
MTITTGKQARLFKGPLGLRAGWRLLIFIAILLPLGYGASRVTGLLYRALQADFYSPGGGAILGGSFVLALLLATSIMGRIERRGLAGYGLPLRRAFCLQFWQGAAISFLSLTVLMLTLRWAGAASFGTPTLRGAEIVRYGLMWTLPLFLMALLEDFSYRGYLLFTLTTGMGFWPAAIITALMMGGAHYLNPGGHGLGPFAATAYCLVTCLVLRRTGDLWMPLGIHSAWSWGEVFFYGVPASGQSAQGHFLSASFHGPVWLTGGVFGPEASWLNLAVIAIWAIGFSLWLTGVKYPNPAALHPSGRLSDAA